MKPVLPRAIFPVPIFASFGLISTVHASAEGDDLRAADTDLNKAY